MQEILDLKQQLLLGNFDEAIDITIELETMARQDKINALNNYLASILNRLIVIQLSERISTDNIIEIRNSLLCIQQRNQLGERFYIEDDRNWQALIDSCFPLALLTASENQDLEADMSVEQLKDKVDCQLLQTEALLLVRLTYTLNAYQIDKYLRFHLLQLQTTS